MRGLRWRKGRPSRTRADERFRADGHATDHVRELKAVTVDGDREYRRAYGLPPAQDANRLRHRVTTS